jgi:predicted amidohydrolase
VKLAAVQVAPILGGVVANVDRHVLLVAEAASVGADLVLFPELSLTGYEPRIAAGLATTQDDVRLDPLQAASDRLGVVVAVGVPLAAAERPHIGMLVFRPRERVLAYAKRLLHPDELAWFAPGGEPLVLDVGGHRLGFAICFEALQDEHVQTVVRLGADGYLASVAKHARGVREAHERLATVAREHAMTVVMANAVGPFADGVAAGRSAAWHADGTLAASLDGSSRGIVLLDAVSGEAHALLR